MARVHLSGEAVDGTQYVKSAGFEYSAHYVSIEFFTDATHQVAVDKATMTGTVEVKASEYGREYGTMTNGTITLGASDYDRPNVGGSYSDFSVNFDSVSGASHFRLTIASF